MDKYLALKISGFSILAKIKDFKKEENIKIFNGQYHDNDPDSDADLQECKTISIVTVTFGDFCAILGIDDDDFRVKDYKELSDSEKEEYFHLCKDGQGFVLDNEEYKKYVIQIADAPDGSLPNYIMEFENETDAHLYAELNAGGFN